MAVKKTPYARGKGGSARQRQARSHTAAVGAAKKKNLFSFFSTDSFKKHQAAVLDTVNSMSFTTKIVLSIAVVTIAVTCLVSLTRSQLTINEKQRALDDLDRQIAQQKLDNEELKKRLKDDGNLDPYIEAYAREKLDMVKPGERVYINTVGD